MHSVNRVLALIAAAFAALATSSHAGTEAYTEQVLYGFCDQCSQGYEPRSPLYEEHSGDLFGTTFGGGHANGGTIFQMHYDGTTNTYKHLLLHQFCSKKDCTDGGGTVSGLVADASGNLYGTTVVGGRHGKGTIYELSFDQTKQTWSYTVLYDFCARKDCVDGATPHSGLVSDESGNFYGTTHDGGAHNYGTIYELFFDQGTQKWVEQVLYSFNCSATDSCPQGGTPDLGLFFDQGDATFFGATSQGANFAGNVFQLSFDNNKQKWVYRDIYDFCAQSGCPDGGAPSGRFVQDAGGTLYATTAIGGAHDQGAVYSLAPSAGGKRWKETVLYSFCISSTCPDGQSPSGTLLMSDSKDMIGTTGSGGANNSGTVYRLTNEGGKKGWVHNILYSFCAQTNCTDGSIPTSGIVLDMTGKLFGTTESGGVFGTVFELTPPP